MELPSDDLASQLVDACPNDKQESKPAFVEYTADDLNAAYQCSGCQKAWITLWKLSYRKASELISNYKPLPQSGNDQNVPQCKQCGAALGQPHETWCSFGTQPAPTAPAPQSFGGI